MMQKNHSSPVRSRQTTVHPRLAEQVRRHLQTDWQQLPQQPTIDAFYALNRMEVFSEQKIILDSGCGTGSSTRLIAAEHPDCLVIGIDKSAARLAKATAGVFPFRQGNLIYLRAELASFWQLAGSSAWKLHRHFLLYPNPWPKPGQLKRRWHAHPVFPTLLKLGGCLEMRCNWEIYAEEFAQAFTIATGLDAQVEQFVQSPITSAFERKYTNSGLPLFTVRTPEI